MRERETIFKNYRLLLKSALLKKIKKNEKIKKIHKSTLVVEKYRK